MIHKTIPTPKKRGPSRRFPGPKLPAFPWQLDEHSAALANLRVRTESQECDLGCLGDGLGMAWECLMEAGMGWIAPSGYVKIAIENGHRNSGFTHWKWWFSIVMEQFTRGYCSGRTGPSWGQGAASECCRRSLGEAGGTHIGGWGNRWGAAGKRSGAKRREWGMIIHEY